MKRQDYISWDEYFMGVALLAAKRSKDPNTQVGACTIRGTGRAMTQNITMLCTPNSMQFLMQEEEI